MHRKSKGSEKAKTELGYKKTSAWEALPPQDEQVMENQAKRYMDFLGSCKTERESLTWLEKAARQRGFSSIAEQKPAQTTKPGTRLFFANKNRAIGFAVIGKKPITDGLHLVAAHHDVPHLDLKALPLYEKHGLAMLKTHYYGGIKKFQWAALPLALHGFVITKSGKQLSFSIGEKPGEPVFTITDLPPHLSYKVQNDRKATEVFKGEELNILVGNKPKKFAEGRQGAVGAVGAVGAEGAEGAEGAGAVGGKTDEKVKGAVLEFLNRTFGLVEEDLAWAEISAVPAFPPREVGFNRDMVGGFGQDDRSCVMAAFEAICNVKSPENTAAVLFLDKEEIGSAGASGAQSMMVSDFFGSLIELANGHSSYGLLRETIAESYVFSGDTNAPIDPNFDAAWDPSNAGFLGSGVWICKFTGSGGKVASSEADIEFVARVRNLLTREKIPYQFGEMGKVDEGGGGTVAKYLAQMNMNVLDLALPVLSLHSPFEILSKVDYHYTIRAYQEFLRQSI